MVLAGGKVDKVYIVDKKKLSIGTILMILVMLIIFDELSKSET